jgi:hypothetical protein
VCVRRCDKGGIFVRNRTTWYRWVLYGKLAGNGERGRTRNELFLPQLDRLLHYGIKLALLRCTSRRKRKDEIICVLTSAERQEMNENFPFSLHTNLNNDNKLIFHNELATTVLSANIEQ